jgi:uncharacterized protein
VRKLFVLLVIALVPGTTGLAVAGPWGGDVGAHERGDTALKLLQFMAAQGDSRAQYDLGFMYEGGKGVAQDYKEALKWYRSAAAQRNGLAQNNLGLMYANGQGVSRDYVRAQMWLIMAAASLNGEDGKRAIEYRDIIANKMAPARIAQARKMAADCVASSYRNCN